MTMTQPITSPSQAIEHIANTVAEFLEGVHGNPQSADTDTDITRLRAIQQAIGDHLDVMLAQSVFRNQPWGERMPAKSSPDVDATVQQIACDVTRLEDMQKQNPALLQSSIDALHESWQRLDLLLEPYAKTFSDRVRRSKSFTPQGRQ